MKLKIILIAILVFNGIAAVPQNPVKLFGVVSDAQTGEFLPSAILRNNSDMQGSAVTNAYGYYLMNIKSNTPVEIEVSFVGYQSRRFRLHLQNDTTLNIGLVPGIELSEFSVSASPKTYTGKPQIGALNLPIEAIKWSPSLLGESNIMAALKSLPGVSAGKEGSSELHVRGGSHDQNLILLDKSPVYNLNHAFGMVSVFNSSALKNVSLYKEGVPAEFGNRLSSALDVSVKEGNRKKYAGDFSLSTIAATATFEGPIVKDKASFLISARRSWPDLFLTTLIAAGNEGMLLGYNFMDINAKVNFSVKDKHHFYVSYYTGQDTYFVRHNLKKEETKTGMTQRWGNNIASARYQSVSGGGAFNEAIIYYSSFNEFDLYRLKSSAKNSSTQNRSLLNEYGLKTSREWGVRKNLKYKLGIDGLLRSIEPPYKIKKEDDQKEIIRETATVHQKELSLFAAAHYSTKKIDVQAGLRGNIFGEQKLDFFSLEPRLSVYYRASDAFAVKAGAMRTSQTVFAMPKTVQGMPGYTWLPATSTLKPLSAWQVSAGINRQNNKLNIDMEIYYKWMKNIAGNYLYPSKLYQSSQWYEIIDQGRGRAFGVDLLAQYIASSFEVNLKYSLSKTEHSFQSVSNGAWIPADYDIRHDISLTGTWTLCETDRKKRWFSGTSAFHSGIPLSLPVQSVQSMFPTIADESYYYDMSYFDYYSRPNNGRMKFYHRFDVGFHALKRSPKGERTWSLGLLNVFNRQNPYSIYKDGNGKYKQLVLFPIMPFISYRKTF